jgi:peptidoglycan/LPS O-acetylase OafA/YrhL
VTSTGGIRQLSHAAPVGAAPFTGRNAMAGRIPGIDGLRVLAVLSVFARHAGLSHVDNGGVGVDVFFVISGFVITGLLVREQDATGAIDLRRFYVARWRRLMPAAVVACLIVAVLSVTVSGRYAGEWKYALLGGTYTMDFADASGHFSLLLGHFWSLATEEQFYLLWPLALAGLFALRARRNRSLLPVVVVLGVCVLPLVERVLLWRAGLPNRNYYSPETRLDQLLAGCLLALFLSHLGDRPVPRWLSHGSWLLAWPAALVLLATVAKWPAHPPQPHAGGYLTVGMTITAAASLVIIASLVTGPQTVLSRLLGWHPLAWVGAQWSYGFYVFHYLVVAWFKNVDVAHRQALSFVASIAAAAASWWLVERRFRRVRVPAGPG